MLSTPFRAWKSKHPLCYVSLSSDKVAYDSLKASNWTVEAAIEFYFASGLSAATPSVDPRAIEQMFASYKGEEFVERIDAQYVLPSTVHYTCALCA